MASRGKVSRDGGETRAEAGDSLAPPVAPSSRIGRWRSLACGTSPRFTG